MTKTDKYILQHTKLTEAVGLLKGECQREHDIIGNFIKASREVISLLENQQATPERDKMAIDILKAIILTTKNG